MGSENLIPGTHQIITTEFFNINWSVRPIMNTIKENLRARVMGAFGHLRYIYD
jgi:hypothetical protein